jgi:hypothetical protein
MDRPIDDDLLFPNIDVLVGGLAHMKHLLLLLLVVEEAEWQRVRSSTGEQRLKTWITTMSVCIILPHLDIVISRGDEEVAIDLVDWYIMS